MSLPGPSRPVPPFGRAVRALLALLPIPSIATAQGYVVSSIPGPIPGAGFGSSIAVLGDLDGDGVPDFAVGAPTTYSTSSSGGQVRILSGADGATLLVVNASGATNNDRFGASLANAGDLNSDGTADLIVGAPQAYVVSPCFGYCLPQPTSVFGPGYARVVSGADGTTLLTLNGSGFGDYFGLSVAGLGDLTGDGVPELLVGAPEATPTPGAGYSQVFSGANGSLLATLTGTGTGEAFGYAVCPLGDLTGDGVPDFAVGAPRGLPGTVLPPTGPLLAGYVSVFSGASAGLVGVIGGLPGERFGAALAPVGDVDGDGVPDLGVGASGGWSYGSPGIPGRTTVFSGASGAVLFNFAGAAALALASAGDFNGDGASDFLVGPCVYSGSTGAVLACAPESGFAVAGPGDMNGDGRDDVLLGSPYFGDLVLGWVGRVAVYSETGVPTGSTEYGSGCSGPGVTVPSIGAVGGVPATGAGNPAFGLRLWNALGGTGAVLVLGTSWQSWAGGTLPLDLTPFGSPGCALYVSPDVLLPVPTTGSGTADLSLPVPAIPALSGALVHAQWYILGPGLSAAPGATSVALQLLVF